MSAKVDVFMPIYIGDYFKDTFCLSGEEHGAYLLLLMHMWNAGGFLPNDQSQLHRMARTERQRWDSTVWPSLRPFFHETGDRITQKRLAAELEKARARKEQAAERASRAAQARWEHPPSTAQALLGDATSPSPSPSKSSSSSPATSTAPSQEGTAPGRARTVALAAPEAPSLFDRVLGDFCETWEGTYGEPYAPTPADRSQLGRLLGGLKKLRIEPTALPELFANYLADTSRFVADEKRHSLAWFCTDGGVNKYRTKAVAAGFSERERRGIANTQAWLQRTGAAK